MELAIHRNWPCPHEAALTAFEVREDADDRDRAEEERHRAAILADDEQLADLIYRAEGELEIAEGPDARPLSALIVETWRSGAFKMSADPHARRLVELTDRLIDREASRLADR